MKLEIVADDNDVEELIKIILTNARTGEVGDGKIFIYPVENAIKVRTGETNGKAL